MDIIENNASNKHSIVADVFVKRERFKEPLPSNDSRINTYIHTEWREGFMNYAVEIGAGAMIYILWVQLFKSW
jgi:hypothetical protein